MGDAVGLMRMKILLIFPDVQDNLDLFSKGSGITNVVRPILGLGKSNMVPPLSLLMLAAVTPEDVEVQILDERLESIRFDQKADLVGISVVTKTALRAFEIADQFRQRSVRVVIGGIHPSVLPKECIQHADAVVIGEGEKVWPKLLEDLKAGSLKPFYYGGHTNDPSGHPWPKRSALAHPDWYLTTRIIMASRGCENQCTFCSCGAALGKRYRKRKVEDVVKEIQSVPGPVVHFLDDNLGWDPLFSKKLLRSLIPMKINWIGAFNVSALQDPELVELIAKSGGISIDIGFESISSQVITEIKKDRTNDLNQYRPVIQRLHDNGISIYGNFIVGFDHDQLTVFQDLINFIEETNIECPMVNILMPYPGSVLFRTLERQGRLLHKNWNYYDDTSPCVVYRPLNMSPEELTQGYLHVINSVNITSAYARRVLRAKTYNFTSVFLGYFFNAQKNRAVKSGLEKTSSALQLAYSKAADT
ncbi:MAG TPA: radical SAM protein [Desulfomonilaceae bacterium]|nr:radical SAM protein [Desulfomonilaceae bacterium]